MIPMVDISSNLSQSFLEDDEKNTIILNEGIGNPEKSIVNESGLYNAIIGGYEYGRI